MNEYTVIVDDIQLTVDAESPEQAADEALCRDFEAQEGVEGFAKMHEPVDPSQVTVYPPNGAPMHFRGFVQLQAHFWRDE